MRKETSKRGKCPRNKTIQRILVPEYKTESENFGGTMVYHRVKNDHPKAGRTLLVYHQKQS